MYAKIDDKGNIIQFPYRELDILSMNGNLPPDAVEVDTEKNKPQVSWDKILFYDDIENIGGSYILNYRISERFSDYDSKKLYISNLIKQYSEQNEKKFKSSVREVNLPYTQDEMNSWSIQVDESKNYLNGVGDYSFIEKLSQNREIELSELVNKIIQKHNNYIENYAKILGIYQRNREILSSIDLNDESTFYLIDQYGW